MPQEIAAKRYAKALFEIGLEKKGVEALKGELLKFKEFSQSGHFDFLNNPIFSVEEKKSVLETFYSKEKPSLDFKNFLDLLVEEKRIPIITEIFDCFVELADEHLGEEKAVVYSAVKLSSDQMEDLKSVLSKIRGKKVKIENILDEKLLGGLRVEVGSFVYDSSVKGFLEKFLALG